MTRPDDRVRIRHALDAALKAVASTADWSRQDLDPDDLETLGLIRLLEIIGEATTGVTQETRSAHAELPWRKMSALRNRLIHGYFDINLDIVWKTLRADLPQLIPMLDQVLRDLAEGGRFPGVRDA